MFKRWNEAFLRPGPREDWFWTRAGQTIGMRAWRLHLVSVDGVPVSQRQAWLRFGMAIISLLALGIGFLWSLFDRDRRCWHDMVSGTRLIRVHSSGVRKS